MAKDKLTEYDATAANNTVVGDVNLAENSALPSDMNNAVREVMSHLKEFATGAESISGLTVAGNVSVDGGTIKLDGNYPTGIQNVAFGDTALDSVASDGNYNVAVGHAALTANSTGDDNTATGRTSLTSNTTGSQNTAIGKASAEANTSGSANTALGRHSLLSNTTASNNTAIGAEALQANTTASNNTAVGYQAGYSNTTAAETTAVGHKALYNNTTAGANTALGDSAMYFTTTGNANVAVGQATMYLNTTGTQNTALGKAAMAGATQTGSYNIAVGNQALYSNTTASDNTSVGFQSGYSNTTGGTNVFVGQTAGYNNTTGFTNTFIGYNSGSQVTTGAKNSILGRYNGNQGGLDIRTSSNNIVLSDGDGTPRLVADGSFTVVNQVRTSSALNYWAFAASSYAAYNNAPSGTGNSTRVSFTENESQIGSIFASGGTSISYNTSSDYRQKENVVDLTGATARLKQLNPKRFNFIANPSVTVDGFIAHEAQAVVPESVTGTKDEVDDEGNPKYQGIDQSKLVPLLVATIQELEARIAALEAN